MLFNQEDCTRGVFLRRRGTAHRFGVKIVSLNSILCLNTCTYTFDAGFFLNSPEKKQMEVLTTKVQVLHPFFIVCIFGSNDLEFLYMNANLKCIMFLVT